MKLESSIDIHSPREGHLSHHCQCGNPTADHLEDRLAGSGCPGLDAAMDMSDQPLIAPASCLRHPGLKAPRLKGACPLNPRRDEVVRRSAAVLVSTTRGSRTESGRQHHDNVAAPAAKRAKRTGDLPKLLKPIHDHPTKAARKICKYSGAASLRQYSRSRLDQLN